MTTFILVLLAIIVTMGAIIYALIKQNRSNKKEIENLNSRLGSAKVNNALDKNQHSYSSRV